MITSNNLHFRKKEMQAHLLALMKSEVRLVVVRMSTPERGGRSKKAGDQGDNACPFCIGRGHS